MKFILISSGGDMPTTEHVCYSRLLAEKLKAQTESFGFIGEIKEVSS